MDSGSYVPKVAAVILNWNGYEDTIECIASLQKANYEGLDILVVDNGSTNDSVKIIRAAFDNITVIETGANLGYTGGNNLGMRAAFDSGAEFAFVLNNDTSVDPNAVCAMVASTAGNPNIGMVGCYVYAYHNPDVFLYPGIWAPKDPQKPYLFPKHEGTSRVEQYKRYSAPCEIDCIHGCAFMIRKAAFAAVHGFDERFFLLHEEVDLSQRVREAGFSVVTVPRARVLHKVGQSFGSESPNWRYYDIRNRVLYCGNRLKARGKKLPPSFWLRYTVLGVGRATKSLARRRPDVAWADLQGTLHGVVGRTGRRP